jgi:hypothetical protein
MTHHLSTLCLTLVLAASAQVHAAGPLDRLKSAAGEQLGGSAGSGGAGSMLGGLGLPSIGSGTASNAAGVLQYCIQNNYLSGGAAGVKDAMLGKLGLDSGKAAQDTGYQSGLGGLLTGSNGSSFDLGKVKADLKEKACDYVLSNAKSLL